MGDAEVLRTGAKLLKYSKTCKSYIAVLELIINIQKI